MVFVYTGSTDVKKWSKTVMVDLVFCRVTILSSKSSQQMREDVTRVTSSLIDWELAQK